MQTLICTLSYLLFTRTAPESLSGHPNFLMELFLNPVGEWTCSVHSIPQIQAGIFISWEKIFMEDSQLQAHFPLLFGSLGLELYRSLLDCPAVRSASSHESFVTCLVQSPI